ncbi:cytochrome P450 monooxygenase [Colletotrichum musicola]|uniref:Cytochrome P450 monooxygenase n=1 Tax=Colletotrichum musicola TaxID=2175873 RepID=A0A8H6JAD3_9PEZI|nr:cytochrome P450 monooxygenase [Colletotrichum musicola]
MALSSIPVPCLGLLVAAAVFSALLLRIIYNLYIHPLRRFHGPWYAASFSVVHAIISVFKREPQWMQSLVKYYGNDKPIRVAPNVLLSPQPEALKDIFCNPKCDTKTTTTVLASLARRTSLQRCKVKLITFFGRHSAVLRNWESRFDAHVQLFIRHMMEHAERNEPIGIAEKSIEVAADIMTMIAFSEPWGFIADKTDQRQILRTWRKGLQGLVGVVLPPQATWAGDKIGLGYVMGQADKQLAERERRIEEEMYSQEYPDFMKLCLEARIDGKPLTDDQKLANVVLLISAGSDTVATTIGRVTTPIQYEEVRENLPFFIACVKEAMRLQPSAALLFGRVAPPRGIVVHGEVIPEGTEMTSIPYIVHQNPTVYAPDPEAYRIERWLEGEVGGNTKEFIGEMKAANFGFGMGPRVCLGKDIAMMEIYKLFIELVRRFDFEMLDEGRFVVVGGIGLNEDLVAKLHVRVKD